MPRFQSPFRAMLISLFSLVLLLAGCGPGAQSSTLFPTVDDPNLEINVTPQSEVTYGRFTIEVKRLGQQARVGWFAEGKVFLKVPMDLGQPDNPSDSMLVAGEGFGKAGFDASGGPCADLGGWPIEYNAFGFFDVPRCELKVTIEEVWPKSEALATCMGMSSSASSGPYKLSFTNLTFTRSQTRLDTETKKDMISWMDTFRLIPGEGLEDSGCEFAPAP